MPSRTGKESSRESGAPAKAMAIGNREHGQRGGKVAGAGPGSPRPRGCGNWHVRPRRPRPAAGQWGWVGVGGVVFPACLVGLAGLASAWRSGWWILVAAGFFFPDQQKEFVVDGSWTVPKSFFSVLNCSWRMMATA